jgi:hypothetical protein
MTGEQNKSSKVSLIQRVTAAWHRHEISTDLCNDLRRALESLPVKTQPAASNEQVYRDALVAIRDRLQLRRKSHEDTQRDNDYAYQNANEALFATGAGFARVSDETSERRDYAAVRDAHDKTVQELARYKQALTRANGFLIMHNLEPVKLEYSSEETTAPPRVPPRSFDIEGHMGLYPSDEVSAPEKTCDHYWHTDGYCVKCEMPQQKARGDE